MTPVHLTKSIISSSSAVNEEEATAISNSSALRIGLLHNILLVKIKIVEIENDHRDASMLTQSTATDTPLD